MAQDLAHKRPYLFGSLIAGISFPATWLFLPIDGGLYAMLWKMAAVGLLVPFALRRHHQGEFILLAIMLAFYGCRRLGLCCWTCGGDAHLFSSPAGQTGI
jgi:hypothetical protein